jgi:lipoyl(octanoyl) transferase
LTAERICKLLRLPGLTDYGEALVLQRQLAQARAAGQLTDDLLILLEHPRVITLGRGARTANVRTPTELLASLGVQLHEVERGGDVTYHGPGQLVGYPIIDLGRHKKDLHWYLRQLEEVLVEALKSFRIASGRVPGYTGVWVEDRKIASIGVHVSRWVTSHGFALNVSTDLADFDLIIPCGIEALKMTSVQRETGRTQSIVEVAEAVARSFAEVFELALEPAELASIR